MSHSSRSSSASSLASAISDGKPFQTPQYCNWGDKIESKTSSESKLASNHIDSCK